WLPRSPTNIQSIHFTLASSFNLDVKNPMIFNGSQADMFGYTVKQFENEEGKWLLIGAPWEGQPINRMGDVYKCPTFNSIRPACVKLNLAESISVPNITQVKENMTLGTTLAPNPKGGFLACGPLYSYKCGSLYYSTGACANVSSNFQVVNTIAPTVKACKSRLDIMIVLDGSNSIYPWPSVNKFLIKLLEKIKIGPQETQVGIMQYGHSVTHIISLNQYNTTEDLLEAAKKIKQYGGNQTKTALGIESARTEEFTTQRGMRKGVSKVMVVVTDGESHDSHNLESVINNCKKDNITMFAIAVLGSYNRGNQNKHFFNVSDEKALVTIAETLGEEIFALEATPDKEATSFKMEMSQVGFSAHYTKDSIMLGAVGADEWNGTVLMLNNNDVVIPDSEEFLNKSDKHNESLAGYLGYSVSSVAVAGVMWYVAGQPRYNHTGQVVIYTSKGKRTSIIQTLKGEQIGSYFGSSVCSVDINQDSITDVLLVGAPMYMGTDKEEQGRVYVYILKKDKFQYEMVLEPIKQQCSCQSAFDLSTDKEPCGSRFGMAIAWVSDLNLDGYNDIVIGAPLENNHQGAAYVFHGKGTIINKQYSQYISTSAPEVDLKYFGQSIDGQMDLNNDGLVDVTVGALGGAALFWSRDIAQVTVELRFSPNKINIQNKNCEISGRQTVCVTMEICFRVRLKPDKEPKQSIALEYNTTIDSARRVSRGLFNETHERKIQRNVTVFSSHCTKHLFYMLETPDFLNPVEILVEFVMVDPDKGPVLDASLPSNARDLVIKYSTNLNPYIVHQDQRKFSLAITLKNEKENAYNPRIVVTYSKNINFTGVGVRTYHLSMLFILCLVSCCQGSFKMKFEFVTSHLHGKVNLYLEATSDSEERSETLGDNKVTISIPVQYEAGLLFSRTIKDDHFKIAANDTISNVISSIQEIGDAVEISYMVSNKTNLLIRCASFFCTLDPSSMVQVNISFRLWKPSFIKVSKVDYNTDHQLCVNKLMKFMLLQAVLSVFLFYIFH
uniref:Integrin subunit alpha 1 n=1 Tax=Callorhinchus milii TaxID=7868 RepID=A0A4W3K8S9_CALMI